MSYFIISGITTDLPFRRSMTTHIAMIWFAT